MSNATLTKPTTVLLIALAGVVVSGLLVFNGLSTQGHAAFNTNNLGISWGLAIVVYDYFLLTSIGLAMEAALSILFGGDTWAPVVKRCLWLALAGLAGGVAVLMLELGYPLRALWAIPTSLQYESPLFWKVLFVAAYVLLLLLLFAHVSRSSWTADSARPLSVALLLVALGVTGLAGSVYGTMSMRPFWSSCDVPVAFIVESPLGGVAFMVFFSYLAYGLSQDGMPDDLRRLLNGPLPTALSLSIVFHGMFVLARTSIGLWKGAVAVAGRGRVAVFGEAAMFSAQLAGPTRTPMGMNAPLAGQNPQFLLNVMHWLVGVLPERGRRDLREARRWGMFRQPEGGPECPIPPRPACVVVRPLPPRPSTARPAESASASPRPASIRSSFSSGSSTMVWT